MQYAAPVNAVSPEGSLAENETTGTDAETCEIVQGAEITLGDGEESFQAYLVQAIKNNTGVAILFLTDIYGFSDGENRDFAYRLACFGYK
jgi:carboxymethylenebutenolidase